MSVKFANNAFGTLNAGINNSATSLTLSSGQGARFPSLGSGEYFYATLIDTSNNLEVVKCTARSTDVLTVTRAQESTTARAFAIGDRVELRVTAQGLIDLGASSTLDADASPSLSANLDLNSNDIVDGSTFLMDATKIRVPGASSNLSSPAAGDMYYNTTDKVIKHWNGTEWLQMSNKFSASGGTENDYTVSGVSYRSHTFTSSGTFISDAAGLVDIIVVAGGGGGGCSSSGAGAAGGGGGAGGCVVSTGVNVSPGDNTIVVGGGGSGSSNNTAGAGTGGDGGNSSGLSISCTGGGGGGSRDTAGNDGGSGGGTNHGDTFTGSGNAFGSGISGQGNNGGNGGNTPSPSVGGGGGGKGSVGQTTAFTATDTGGNGGNAIANAFRTGTNENYAGGGGGGGGFNAGGAGGGNVGADGADGDGVNSSRSISAPNNATANRGGGGGGSAGTGNGSNGASGIVVIRYTI